MHAEPDLRKLVHQAGRRCLLLAELVRYRRLPVSAEDDRIVSFVTIEALNLWMGFCRSYFLSTALRARDGSGQRITVGVAPPTSQQNALTVAIHKEYPKRRSQMGPWSHRDEPPWQDVRVFGRVLGELKPSNLGVAHAALGHSTRAPQHLPVLRNFYAHRSEGSANRARTICRSYALSPSLRPSELLCTRLPGRPQTLLADWIDDLRVIIQGMV